MTIKPFIRSTFLPLTASLMLVFAHDVGIAQPKLDGEWIGKMKATEGPFCTFDKEFKVEVAGGMMKANFVWNVYDNPVETVVSDDGLVSFSRPMDFETFGTGYLRNETWTINGQFAGNRFKGEFGMSSAGGSCNGQINLARKGSLEATALLTGQDVEILQLEQEANNVTAERNLTAPGESNRAQVDSNRPYDGVWMGTAKSDDPDVCRIESKIESLTVTDFGYKLVTSSGGYEGRVSATGQISDWIKLDVWNGNDGDIENLSIKLDGKFQELKFDGNLSVNLDNGGVCTASLNLGPEGSVRAEALLTGKNPRLLAIQRQIAAAQARFERQASGSNNASLSAEREAEEKRLAELKAEQAKLLKAEEARLSEIRAQQKEEEERLASIRAEAERKAQELARIQEQQASLALPAKGTSHINFGNYHALVIGINDYEHLPRLKTAVADAEAVAEILGGKYGFKVTKLLNPTREDIMDHLDDFRETLEFKDNLLIYYAGHGWLDERADQGYWLPANAKKRRRSRWVSNATITDTLKSIRSKHVMVVADSCYSGRLVRGLNLDSTTKEAHDFYKQMSRKKARVVITSGGLEPVEDGKGKHSPFARAFLSALNNNSDVLDGTKLFNTIRRPVMVNANQTPQYSDVRRAGHDGGDFLFVRRN